MQYYFSRLILSETLINIKLKRLILNENIKKANDEILYRFRLYRNYFSYSLSSSSFASFASLRFFIIQMLSDLILVIKKSN